MPPTCSPPPGLIVLEKPIRLPDYHPGTGIMTDFIHVGIRAIGWTPEVIRYAHPEGYDPAMGALNTTEKRPGTMIFTYTTNEDWKNTYARDVTRAIKDGKLAKEEVERIFLGTEMDSADDFYDQAIYTLGAYAGRDHLIPSDVMAWAFGRKWGERATLDYVPGTVDTSVAYMRRWFLTLMRFSWQKLVTADHPVPSKKLHSRMVEAKRPKATFSVLRLRRSAEKHLRNGHRTEAHLPGEDPWALAQRLRPHPRPRNAARWLLQPRLPPTPVDRSVLAGTARRPSRPGAQGHSHRSLRE